MILVGVTFGSDETDGTLAIITVGDRPVELVWMQEPIPDSVQMIKRPIHLKGESHAHVRPQLY